MKSEMLNWLREYLQNTPQQQLQKDWNEIEGLNFEGPKAYEYIGFMQRYCCYGTPPGYLLSHLELPKNTTPNYSESFF